MKPLLLPKPVLITVIGALLLLSAHLLAGNNDRPLVQWQQKVIRVDNQSNWDYSTQVAIAKWNQARVGVSFVLNKNNADVIIKETRDFMSGCDNKTTVGCSKVGRHNVFGRGQNLQLKVKPDNLQDQGQMSSVVAHELGHVLGLRHPEEKKGEDCVLMSHSDSCRRQVELKMIVTVDKDAPGAQASSVGYYHNQGRTISFEKTHHLICGPSREEIRLLRHWYGGPGPNYRSWEEECSFKEGVGEEW